MTNGNSFSQPASVGTVLGIFTLVALIASFATAIYGEAVPTMRLHYAHSLSVGVVFAVFQHIYFTGALSVNWPSVLVAWWSNFAWAGGMIYSSSMQASINNLIGNNVGNTSEVGAASSGSTQESLGGGYDISQIYKRTITSGFKRAADHPLLRDIATEIYRRPHGRVHKRDILQRTVEQTLQRRALANSSEGFHWYGHPVGMGLPLPGNYSGFAGTLAEEGIRASNAFMTGFLWFLILLVLLVAAVMAFKWILEGLARVKAIHHDRLKFFRDHWLGYSAVAALRICYLGFFAMTFLTIFQFTYESSGGVKGVAAIVFIIFMVGVPGLAIYACLYKKKAESGHSNSRQGRRERKTLLGRMPWFGHKKASSSVNAAEGQPAALESKSESKPFWKRQSSRTGTSHDDDYSTSIHDNDDYTMRFGWLTARFRRTRWWFFTFWLFYEFLRAVFYGGASGHALTQVFGLLVVEILAFAFIVWARPFEGRRLNILVVYCLGFSKVASVALSAAFDVQFNLQRITTTVIGIVIIVIQGILTIITLIAIVVGAISSYMSISRNKEDFRPRKWAGLREKYFNHLDRVVNDMPPEPVPEAPPQPEEPKEPYFEMKNVRRVGKIEDDDEEFASEMRQDPLASYVSLDRTRPPSRAASVLDGQASGTATPKRGRTSSLYSMNQTTLPYGARPHRPSWSTRDFADAERVYSPVESTADLADDDTAGPSRVVKSSRIRTPSWSSTLPNPKLRPQSSSPELRLGTDVSSRDSIGKVPAPIIRPRSGTYGARVLSGYGAQSFGVEPGSSGDGVPDLPDMPKPTLRSKAPLTPAQEMEEFALTPRVSNER